tara:strand:+ start:1878 stop:4664 length:2787 start_codon:yes stop_codon:yes gene_type:complete
MLSRAQYQGRLPYDEYVRRTKLRFAANKQRLKEEGLLPTLPTAKEATDMATERAKKEFHDAVAKQTGIDTDQLSKAYDAVKGGPPSLPADKRKKNEIITGIAINRAIIPNTKELTDVEIDRAKISMASKIAHLNDDEFRTAQDYMDENNLGQIDTELSDSSGLVVKRPNGETEIHFRGTALTNKPNFQDLITDGAIMAGAETGVPGLRELSGKPKQITMAETQLESAVAKYGAVDHIGGYSRGGGMALYLGNKHNIPTTTFNPLVGPNAIANSHSTTASHTIIRTTEDPTTIGLAFANPNSDTWNVKAVLPHADYQSKIPLKNVYDAHRLDNFTRNGPRKTQEAEQVKAQAKFKKAAAKQSERMMLADMRDSIKNNESFTDYMVKYNPGDAKITPKGKRLVGARFGESSSYTEGWYKAGGRFTEGEAEYANQLRNTDDVSTVKPHREITDKARQDAQSNLDDPLVGGESRAAVGNNDAQASFNDPFLSEPIQRTNRQDGISFRDKLLSNEPLTFSRDGSDILDDLMSGNPTNGKRTNKIRNKIKNKTDSKENRERQEIKNDLQEWSEELPQHEALLNNFSPEDVKGTTAEARYKASQFARNRLMGRKEDLNNRLEELESAGEVSTDGKLRNVGSEERKLIDGINSNPSSFELDRQEMDEYREGASTDEALAIKHTEAEQAHFKSLQEFDDISSASYEHTPDSTGGAWRSANATNLAIGYGIGMGVQGLANIIPGEKEFEKTAGGRATMDVSKGAATGLAQAAATKGLGGLARNTIAAGFVGDPANVAFLPEAVGGAVGYVAGDYASEGASVLTKMAGGKKGTQDLAGDVVGGGVGGGVGALAAIGTGILADAALGTEYGAILGPEGAAAGAIIGTGLGLAMAVKDQGFKGVYQDTVDIYSGVNSLEQKGAKAFAGGLKSIASSISSWF